MKKLLTISLAIFYLLITSGLFLNLHYCGGGIKKIAFYMVNDEDGCCGSEKKSEGCCKNKSSFIKVKDDHHSFGGVKIAQSFIKCHDVIQKESNISLSFSRPCYKETDHDPPVLYDPPIFLKHRALLV